MPIGLISCAIGVLVTRTLIIGSSTGLIAGLLLRPYLTKNGKNT